MLKCLDCRFWTPPPASSSDPRGNCQLSDYQGALRYETIPVDVPLAALIPGSGLAGEVHTLPGFGCHLAQPPACHHGRECDGAGPDCSPPDEDENTHQDQVSDETSLSTSQPAAQLPDKRERPKSLPSTTTMLRTEQGNLYITVSTDQDGRPFEIFGALGKSGGLEHGMTELACRLISLHLRRDTPLDEIIDQCQGIQEMQAWPNPAPPHGEDTITVLGLGDGIAHVLKRLDDISAATRPTPQEATTEDPE